MRLGRIKFALLNWVGQQEAKPFVLDIENFCHGIVFLNERTDAQTVRIVQVLNQSGRRAGDLIDWNARGATTSRARRWNRLLRPVPLDFAFEGTRANSLIAVLENEVIK